ncbi:MAG: esterase-like activity of phytase family protein [Cyanobacteria bacterium J06643_4]
MTPSLTKIGSFTSEFGAEIAAYDATRQYLYVVAGGTELQVIDLSDPTNPTEVTTVDIADFGAPVAGANSIAYSNGLLAVALEAETQTDNGVIALVDIESAIATANPLDAVKVFTVGALPDMVTFTPDGTKILVANEGEPDEGIDPDGSVSIIDISGEFNSLSQQNVSTADFLRFNGREADLRADGVRIFPDAQAAQDFEPEYIAVSPDGTKAFVTLQENNAIAVIDIETATVEGIQPLGLKDFSKGLPNLTSYDFINRGDINNGGAALTTATGETIELGGFSGLYYDGVAANGNLQFLAVPDRGPNGDADGNNRPFLLPDYQARIVAFELNEATGEISIADELLLKRADGTPITGLPNIPNVDRQAVDALGNPVDLPELEGFDTFGADYDPLGADLESILRDGNGNFWTVDEYRPAIYQFDQGGTLINRFVPDGTAEQATEANPGITFTEGTFGSETLPAEYLNRRANRGFEGAALDTETGIFYAFIQTPLSNPDRSAGDDSSVIRILGIDPSTGQPVSEYVYLLQDPEVGNNVDKIGDAVFAGDGKFYVLERDSALADDGQKFVFEIDIKGATNVLGQDFGELTLEQQTPDDLVAAGISPVSKRKITNLPSIGYLPSDKPEGIALLPDGRIAVLNDNDFGLEAGAEAVQLGIIDFEGSNGLDASDRDDAINIEKAPVFGLYMPDSIASFESGGETFYVIANEGDDRGDADEAGRGDAIRLKDLADVVSFGREGLALDDSFDPGLLEDEALGRLTISSIDGDTDGDGDLDQIVSYGGRSFSVLDANGNIVFDSGDQIARITAEQAPELFNANDGDPEEFDNRSDNKGAEPEAVTTGVIGGRPYAFVGLERAGGGVLVYDLSDPRQPEFIQYVRSDDDIAPEGLNFISASESATGQPLLSVANEESNTIALYAISVPSASISEIQGAAHISPLVGEVVQTTGIVTGVAFNGFYLQGESDDDETTSDGVFVFTGARPTVTLGDETKVFATVSEFIPGGADTGNLSITQLTSPEVLVLSSGNDLPEAVVIGQSGRVAPTEVVISSDELPVNLQNEPGNFDPAEDAIDFYESLEGMRVTIEDAAAVSPTRVFNRFSAEAVTLPNQGEFATPDGVLNARGGISLRSGPDNTGDQNPERVQIQFDPNLLPDGFDTPALTVGDKLGDVTGVVGYSFGNYEVNVTEAFDITPSGLTQEVTELAGTDTDLTVASYNILNLSALEEDDAQRDLLAQQVVENLGSPDIIGLQEIQDNNGTEGGGENLETDATETLQKLVDAIAAAGGPTYAFADIAPEPNAFGGAPGSNIRNAFLYNTERVSLNSVALLDGLEAFAGSRDPLIGKFTFDGSEVTIVNNHFSSRFGSTPVFGGPQPFVQAGEEAREAQSQEINDYVDGLLSADPTANVVVLGDLNTFEFTNDLAEILPGVGDEKVLTNLVEQAVANNEAYSFIFDGNSQILDSLYVSDGLLPGAKFDIVHVNNDFPRDDGRNLFTDTVVASDHEPLVAQLTIPDKSMENFQLQLLHLADQEAGIPALDDAPRASAVLNALRDDFDNTLTLSSGDAIIPGLFFSASADAFGGAGRADILIQNELGIQAIALGNHEFDLGTGLVRDLVQGGEDDPETTDIDESFVGALFPYLSSNLDFSTSEDLADLVVEDDKAPLPNSIAATTVIDVNGEAIGVVGATTPTLPTISSPGDVTVLPADFDGNPTPAQLDALAAEIQKDVDEMIAANPGLNKVVVLSHMQQIAIEQELATRLTNVDVIVAGGSNTRLFDENDRPRAGDSEQGPYPIFTTDADGKPVAVVNTDGNYKYIGRLVVEFDENGNIIPESYDAEVSGAYATDEQGVADLDAEGLVDPEIQEIVDTLREVIIAKESNLFGNSEVYLDGRRGSVRTQETNLGNLTADANLAIAKETDPSVVISLKNGGGIRDDIGQVIVPAGGTGEPEFLPTEEIPGVKPAGGISETDIANTLRFNNGLTLLTVTAEELLAVLEHAVAASSPDDENTQGRFPQVAGIQFSFDLTAEPGNRIQSAAILDEDGNDADVLVQNGELVGDSTRTFRMVTLGFLAGGGDGFPFPQRDVVDLALEDDAPRTGDATFAPDGSEQDALAEYLLDNFGENNPFTAAETSRAEDTRIQNLAFREDTVIDGNGGNGGLTVIEGTEEKDTLVGTEADEEIKGLGKRDRIFGEGGNDTISGDEGNDLLFGDGRIESDTDGDDIINGGDGADIINAGGGDDELLGGRGRDLLNGGSGDDLLYGGQAKDRLTGGAGADIFAIAIGDGPFDRINDFVAGEDLIGLRGGLTFGQLTISRAETNNVMISADGENLAKVINANVGIFTESAFTAV